jgi:hypothetical protein
MPVPPVVVTCVDARGVHRRQLTGGDGTFHFRGLPPGDVKVEVLRFYAATDPSDRVRRISRHALAGDVDVRLVLD